MKRTLKLVIAFALTVAVLLSITACGAKDVNKNVINGVFSEFLVTEKIGTVDRDNFTTNDGGLVYKGDNDLWGIISYEGLYDSGARYADVTAKDKYFQVRNEMPASADDIEAINKSNLIDGRGNYLALGFAAFDVISDKYVVAYTATERTYIEDDAMISYNTDTGSTTVGASSADTAAWYKAEWRVYNVEKNSSVYGARGQHQTYINAYGDFITFNDENNEQVRINSAGEKLPEDAKLFDDGSYRVEGKIGEVYASDGTKLFSYDLTGYQPEYVYGDYYSARKYTDGQSYYAVMNKKGELLSQDYTESITIYGEILLCGNTVYNLTGTNIIAGTYTSIKEDKVFGKNWMLYNEEFYTLIDSEGKVYYNGGGDDQNVYPTDFVASTKKDDVTYYFSHKDQDYTIQGYAFSPWIIKTSNANSMYDLIDTMTGETLLAGYKDFSYISLDSFAYYVYAEYNGGADVYLIVSGAQIEEVTAKKNNLYDDLIAAFAAEGITVSVNKETGEIALDSSVLFGGDSSELTADGKAFLNKFIKAYTTVVYSEEYNGFISKTMVEGHTAPVAGSTYASGYDLSVERATNVKQYCLSSETGIDTSALTGKLTAVGYSNSQPVYDANGEVDMAASRRVSFRFMVKIEF